MKSKILFWILVISVFGGIILFGFLFAKDNKTAFWLIEIIAILSVVLFIILYQRLIKPYQVLLNGMELMNEQDFSSRLRPVQQKEANQLIEIFNKMMEQLKNERLLVREKNQFLDLLIHASPQGVIILDFDERITDINPAGLTLLKINNISDVQGKHFSELDTELAPTLAALKAGESIVKRTIGFGAYKCSRSSFIDQGFNHPFILVEELSHELYKIEKESYETIIRMMSHEVNNSIGAISATLSVISEIIRQDQNNEWDDLLQAVDASRNRCGHLTHFIGNLGSLVKIPKPQYSTINLNELARTVDAIIRVKCRQRNIILTSQLSPDEPVVSVDGIQFEQVLVNILKNAYEAIGENGEIHIITQSEPLSIAIEDNGTGISDNVKQKLFTPFFSTKNEGQGIGLMFIREVLTSHNCKFELTSENGWTRFVITF